MYASRQFYFLRMTSTLSSSRRTVSFDDGQGWRNEVTLNTDMSLSVLSFLRLRAFTRRKLQPLYLVRFVGVLVWFFASSLY